MLVGWKVFVMVEGKKKLLKTRWRSSSTKRKIRLKKKKRISKSWSLRQEEPYNIPTLFYFPNHQPEVHADDNYHDKNFPTHPAGTKICAILISIKHTRHKIKTDFVNHRINKMGDAEIKASSWRLVEVGRIVLIQGGSDDGKLATIVEIIDHKRVCFGNAGYPETADLLDI